MTDRSEIQTYIEQQLESLCRRPEMWGDSICVELQYLLLIEFWLVNTRPELEQKNPRIVRDEFQRFCRRAGYNDRIPLADNKIPPATFQRLLLEFKDSFSKRMTPPNPFEEHDFTVAFNLKKGRHISDAIVSQGLGNVRRVLRAALRPEKARGLGGRTRKEIEALTDFEVLDIDIRHSNGVGARIVFPMRQQTSLQIDWDHQEKVRKTLGSLVDMAEWASSTEPTPLTMASPQERDWIAWQAIQLIPHGDVESMELGGKLISRSRPVMLTSQQRPKLISILDSTLETSEYRKIGTIRALDRDSAVLKFRAEGENKNIECWLADDDDLKRSEENLCARVEVRGKKYTGVARKPVVLINELIVMDTAEDDPSDRQDLDA